MKKSDTIVWIGFISIWFFFVIEITTDIWFGSKFPGYNWRTQSLSYLGQDGSPIKNWVSIWGIGVTLFISIFVLSFFQTFKSNRWAKTAAIALLIYGLGEGIGSGCFPINPPGTDVTLNARLHNIFSGIGDTGIVLLPFIFMFMFPRSENRKLHVYLWTVAGFGMLMASFFLSAKYFHLDNFISDNKGVWQRIYILDYYAMLLVISVKMLKINYHERKD
jgi:hypothetical protein